MAAAMARRSFPPLPALVIAKALIDPSTCVSHPHYQAKRRPRTTCPECRQIWNAVQMEGGQTHFWAKRALGLHGALRGDTKG